MKAYKRCNQCKEELPLDDFYLVYNKQRGKKYRRGHCRYCDNERARVDYRKHTERRLRQKKEYYERDPYTTRLRVLLKRCKLGFINKQELRQLVINANNTCQYCGGFLNGNWTIDHATAVSKGGTNDVENLRVCCLSCNSKKRDMNEGQFLLKIKGVPF